MFEGQPINEDAQRVFQCVQDGGVAIFPVSVGYAIVGHADEAIKRTYAAKERSFEKPCGNFGDWQLFNEMPCRSASSPRFGPTTRWSALCRRSRTGTPPRRRRWTC